MAGGVGIGAGAGAGKKVAVTGASGYIASWLIKFLLHRGYSVNATVRNLHDASKTKLLLALDGAGERLHLFEADLLEEGSFDYVVDGCVGVFHTASPVLFSVADPQMELIDPAVKGTLNVLKSCAKVPFIKRVVVTSSMASVTRNTTPLVPGVVVDETWFSDVVHCEQTKQWYALSKTLAEDAAWNFSKENGIDIVLMHPCTSIGPLLQPTLNFASDGILNYIKNGKELDLKEVYRCVDVRDVAWAHIYAFEIPSASGRYCLVGAVLYVSDVLQILQKLYPALNVSEREDEKKPLPPPYEVSKERAKSLGVEFTPLEVSLRDSIESLRENKFVDF